MARLWIIIALLSGVFVVSGWWWGLDVDTIFSKVSDLDYFSSESLKNIFPNKSLSGLEIASGILSNDVSNSIDQQKSVQESVTDSIKRTISQTTNSAYAVVEKTGKEAVDEAQSYIDTMLASVKKNVTDISGLTFIDNNDSSNTQNRSFSFVIRVNEPAMFVVKNNEEDDLSYSVDWGDGDISAGTVEKKSEKIVQHAWNTVGDHTVKYNNTETIIRVVR